MKKNEFKDFGLDIWKKLFQKHEYNHPEYFEKDKYKKIEKSRN